MKNDCANRNSINSVSDFAELAGIRSFVRCKALEFGFSEEDAQKISLAVDEAVTNLIKHAYKLDSEKQIRVEIDEHGDEFTVNILDDGIPFNPLNARTPDMIEYLKNYEKGGLGIHIMKLVMDDIAYLPGSPAQNRRNMLKLTKRLR